MINEAKQKRLKKISIEKSASLIDALKIMDAADVKLLVVLDGDKYLSVLSSGDVQRAIIANHPLDTSIEKILRPKIRVASVEDNFESVKETMLNYRIEFMPCVDSDENLVDIHFWDDVFPHDVPVAKIDLPVVIMAGGKGTRLKPFSNVLPKALFPLGEKTILEVILDKFHDVGCKEFFLSVNYKHEFIKTYIEQLGELPYSIDYFKEEKPLGTAGSLFLVKERIKQTFFVSNCDIIINADYSEILDFHNEKKNKITIVGALKQFTIPYGTLRTTADGQLESMLEKPEMNYFVNTGMYILEPELLEEIPENEFFHITQLIENVRVRRDKVGVFPVSEKSWNDIGEWAEYHRTVDKFNLF